MEVLANTKVYKNYQTAIPKVIREMFKIDKKTVIEWGIDEDGKPQLSFRKKVTVNDVLGMMDDDGAESSVELKRGLYKWANS